LALYYFHLRDGDDVLLDPEGREFDGVGAIAAAALVEARAILSSDALSGLVKLDYHIDVEDEHRAVVHRLAFIDAVELILPAPAAASGAAQDDRSAATQPLAQGQL
jgi:hypothetical protein